MNIRNLAIIPLFATVFSCSTAFGQQPSPVPTPNSDKQLTVLRLTKGTLREELVRSEIEPRSKRFEMNLRFLRAKYSKTARQNAIEHQYLWDYFPEAVITVQFVEYPAGFFSKTSADERRKKADELLDSTLSKAAAVKGSGKDIEVGGLLVRQVEFTLNGQKHIARTFAGGDAWYVLYAQPRNDDAGPLIDKLFDSFKFVKN
jgi:hypothetical protein